jgi:hypothetical protein
MKKGFLLIALLCFTGHMLAQKGWFTLYQDSTMLVKDAEKITTAFKNDIKRLSPATKFEIKAVLKTTPYLIYYDERDLTANLPIWDQVIPEQKSFFYEVAGGEAEGKEIFGLFFNGFYLPHELAHAFQDATSKTEVALSYQNEYLANTMAILWWRKQLKEGDLQKCYEYAKKIAAKLSMLGLPVGDNMRCKLLLGLRVSVASCSKPMVAFTRSRKIRRAVSGSPFKNKVAASSSNACANDASACTR